MSKAKAAAPTPAATAAPAPRAKAAARAVPAKGGTPPRAPSLKNEAKRRARERERAEKDLETRETELKDVEARLADPDIYADAARTKELLARYETLRRDVDGLWKRLEELEGV